MHKALCSHTHKSKLKYNTVAKHIFNNDRKKMGTGRILQHKHLYRFSFLRNKFDPPKLHVPNVSAVACPDELSVGMWQGRAQTIMCCFH